ncbi:glycoside hydrolase family 1 protein [Curtobacterium sp. MCJR17_055]|uniref:family 1 glycosylhydrolase n=1 Tax=unclassified Curtobacterium TaxID=257496 RepID=UPI000DA02E91|nr:MULTISPECIES: family 1 glycosylhydrolase [unclassified Curtobacterium]PYY37869.1 glycoside hydrolase family 1 protein [Curtobacterium sp. MCBD17_029]PYY56896.1 glycoside hydrolase family 1 protein [Curtobacterium sp. MCJR17_055]PYY62189.1 glycoside hydrolase family 1 protein [Curtobacterium sp. MCPF17_015]WIB36057.1 family 1 glycosylhydrolase [Curtobacterium sp. MCJR17_043]
MSTLPTSFLWGASTAPHQVEGNNINSDWWTYEQMMPHFGPSGDAVDSYHRFEEDMRLLADAGLTAYRFGVEWARIEPLPGQFSVAELAHYRRMIDTAIGLGLTPVVTLHHFTAPRWFVEEGGWLGDTAIARFTAYVSRVAEILDGVEWVCTINEPNMLALMVLMSRAINPDAVPAFATPTVQTRQGVVIPAPTLEVGQRLVQAHHAARDVLRQRTDANVGWTVACLNLWATPENAEHLERERYAREDLYLEAARGDDFIGVQAYSTREVDENGLVTAAPHPDNTLTGDAYRPESLGIALRHAADVAGVPALVTENGIATADDDQRISYTTGALAGLLAAVADGVDVRGYLHWSALDNFEWGHWEPTFGLIAVDRSDFSRHPKPSLAWLGGIARSNAVDLEATP